MVGVAALAGSASAQTATATPSAIDTAVAQAQTLLDKRQYQAGVDLLTPMNDGKSAKLMIMLARHYQGLRLPNDCKTAVGIYDKVIAMDPKNVEAYDRRGDSYDCLGVPFLAQRLENKEKVVELAEAASPLKEASAGNYTGLGGAYADNAAPAGVGAVDFTKANKALELRSRGIGMTPEVTQANLRDKSDRIMARAELLNSRFANPTASRDDADEAYNMVRRRLDMTDPANWYRRAEIARRYANLPASVTAAASGVIAFGTSTRPQIAQVRNEAIDYYTRYINAFESSGRDFVKYPSAIDAYTNKGANYNSMGGTQNKRTANENYAKAFELNPRELRRLGDIGLRLVEINEGLSAKTYFQQYLTMTQGVDIQALNGRFAAEIRKVGG
jgi:tetratricopeptide (TPR) repeat protein